MEMKIDDIEEEYDDEITAQQSKMLDDTKNGQAKAKMHIGSDMLEDFKRAHLDETRRKYPDGLKEGRDTSPVEEKSPVTKREISCRIEFVKKHEIRHRSRMCDQAIHYHHAGL
jgi:hypothetical protein